MYFLPLDILPLRFALESPLSAPLGQGHPVQEAVVAEQQQGGLRAHASWGRKGKILLINSLELDHSFIIGIACVVDQQTVLSH